MHLVDRQDAATLLVILFSPGEKARGEGGKEKREGGGGKKILALTGNRTRASRVAGENSTTEPSVPVHFTGFVLSLLCHYSTGRRHWLL